MKFKNKIFKPKLISIVKPIKLNCYFRYQREEDIVLCEVHFIAIVLEICFLMRSHSEV